MNSLVELVQGAGNNDRVISAAYLKRLLGGSDARRYGLVNRALKRGELLSVRRGQYVLADRFRHYPVSHFALAQQMMPGSYISTESALSFHGWIPEAVHTVVSMVHEGKSNQISHPVFGQFEFRRMTVKPGYFLHAVARHELQQQVAFIAQPLRALLDLIYLRKLPWQGLDFLLQGLRIDEQFIQEIKKPQLNALLNVYQGKRERQFIHRLSEVLGDE